MNSFGAPVELAKCSGFCVRVEGGADSAEKLAAKHSCVFGGQVGSLTDYYKFELPVVKHGDGSSAPVNISETLNKLQSDPDILWVEMDVAKVRVKRDSSQPEKY